MGTATIRKLITGDLVTTRVINSQKPWPEDSEGAILDLPKKGMGKWLILGPMIARLAGQKGERGRQGD